MKTLMFSLATGLVLAINSTASAWVVQAGPVTVAGRSAVVRPVQVVRPAVRPAVRSAVVHQRRELAVETIQNRRETARQVLQDRREIARELIQDQRQAALDAILNAQQL